MDRYRGIDEHCATLNFKMLNLVLPQGPPARRSLRRDEYDGQGWQELIPHYGSEESVLAIGQSRLESTFM
jgi:hypothetical protein